MRIDWIRGFSDMESESTTWVMVCDASGGVGGSIISYAGLVIVNHCMGGATWLTTRHFVTQACQFTGVPL